MATNPPPEGLEAVRAYAGEINRKKDLETALKACNARIDALTAPALDHFQSEGVTQIKVRVMVGNPDLDGPNAATQEMTIFLRTEHWPAKAEECEGLTAMQIRERFMAAGMEEFCEPRMNVQSLRAYFGEQLKAAEESAKRERRNAMDIDPESVIPDALKGIVQIKTVYKVGARRAS